MGKTAKLFEIGEKIGVVTIVERVYNEARKEWEYICECRCGNRFKSRRDHLLKPRQGCRWCINKVKADIDLANTISEEEFRERVDAKNFEKMQKRDGIEQRKKERAEAKIKRAKELADKKQKFKDSRLTSPVWFGQRFDRLVVIDSYSKNNQAQWVLQCDCGNIVEKPAKLVKFGHYISCGCKAREIQENAVSKERLYGIWCGMKNRCLNQNNPNWHNYGGRGINICNEWVNSYKVFREWAYQNGWTEEMPKDHNDSLSIERINVNGNYEPSNCCFIPLRNQCLNKRPYSECKKRITKRDLTMITINGETKSQRYWQEFYNVSSSLLQYRLKIGLSLEDALSIDKYSLDKSLRLQKIDKKIGNVEVLDAFYDNKRGEWAYRCRCNVCGSEFDARRDQLLKPRVGCRACSNRITARNRNRI